MDSTAPGARGARRALLSVTDKTGIVELARGLLSLGFELISTGGTARALEAGGVAVTPLERFTGWPEMLDGRVKTLHPKVHAGILARRDLDSHRAEMAAHQLEYLEVVVVNLYDFEGAVRRADASFEAVVEEIDIGGPTLLRAAAKNHAAVLPVVDPADYGAVLEALAHGAVDAALRERLAHRVFLHTARYDALIAAWLGARVGAREQELADLPEVVTRGYRRVEALRYGENPHQRAAFYRELGAAPSLLTAATQLQGKELSFNNLLDLDAAFGLAVELGELSEGASCVFIKHNNPCGAAAHADVAGAIAAARACDPTSAFGGVVAVTEPLDEVAAERLVEAFVEAVIAPGYSAEALEVLAAKKNLRVLRLAEPAAWAPARAETLELREVHGGALLQTRDAGRGVAAEVAAARVVTRRAPTAEERVGLGFTWAVAKHVRSNAIVFGLPGRVVAVGAGQMSRVDSVKICRLKAGDALVGTVVASDAFFPFRDGVEQLAEAGATAIIQPGGSIRDEEVIAAADERGLAMLFTGVRHFRH
jgi:phosphoribosylaminoimidazolecarboxamide formyltransferase/IMP cyclohydrolase